MCLTNDDATVVIGDVFCVEFVRWCGGDPDIAHPSYKDHCSPKVRPQVSLQSGLQVSVHNNNTINQTEYNNTVPYHKTSLV